MCITKDFFFAAVVFCMDSIVLRLWPFLILDRYIRGEVTLPNTRYELNWFRVYYVLCK